MQKNDIIIFKYKGITLKYEAILGINEWFLANKTGGLNKKIFDLLEIENRFTFCKKAIGYSIKDTEVDFPQVKTLKDLEKIVDALYQRIIDISIPKFEKGEIVKIVSKHGPELSYPYGYVRDMEKLVNFTDTIENINKMSIDVLKQNISLEKYQEPFSYRLQNHPFKWTSAMLESVSEENNEKEEVPPKFNKSEDGTKKIISEPRDLSVIQKEFVEAYDTTKADSILLPPELPKSDINTQTTTFGNIKITTGTIPFKEEKDSNVDYKLNFNVKPLKF